VGAQPVLRVELLGGFRVLPGPSTSLGPGDSVARVPSVRQQELIALLVLHARNAPIPRQRIAGLLWPESTDAQALTNLRRELHHLREAWPRLDALIDAGSRALAWHGNRGAIADLLAFEDAAERGLAADPSALQEAARLYKGDLLPDCRGEWIDADRERLRQRARKVLARLADILERDGAFADAIERIEHLLRLEPLDEKAWCALMRCHARRGERAAALHVYQQCAALLKKELGIQPSAATRMTYREILDVPAEMPVMPAAPRTAVYPLVGRPAEWYALLGAWGLPRRAGPGSC
jgi:DNA-binding SARP family transcriptional activator